MLAIRLTRLLPEQPSAIERQLRCPTSRRRSRRKCSRRRNHRLQLLPLLVVVGFQLLRAQLRTGIQSTKLHFNRTTGMHFHQLSVHGISMRNRKHTCSLRSPASPADSTSSWRSTAGWRSCALGSTCPEGDRSPTARDRIAVATARPMHKKPQTTAYIESLQVHVQFLSTTQ